MANLTPLEVSLYDNAVAVGNTARIRAFHEKVSCATGRAAEISPKAKATLASTVKASRLSARGVRRKGRRPAEPAADEGGPSI